MVLSSFDFIVTTSTGDSECVWMSERGKERKRVSESVRLGERGERLRGAERAGEGGGSGGSSVMAHSWVSAEVYFCQSIECVLHQRIVLLGVGIQVHFRVTPIL